MGCTGDIDLRTEVIKGTMVNDHVGGFRKDGNIVCIQIQKSGRPSRLGRLWELRETNINSVQLHSQFIVVVTLVPAQP